MPERKSFLLRLDPEIHRALQRWADDELRSLNGQLEFLLREALRRSGRLPSGQSLPPSGGQSMPGSASGDRTNNNAAGDRRVADRTEGEAPG